MHHFIPNPLTFKTILFFLILLSAGAHFHVNHKNLLCYNIQVFAQNNSETQKLKYPHKNAIKISALVFVYFNCSEGVRFGIVVVGGGVDSKNQQRTKEGNINW